MGTKFDKIFLADGDLHVEGPFETHGEVVDDVVVRFVIAADAIPRERFGIATVDKSSLAMSGTATDRISRGRFSGTVSGSGLAVGQHSARDRCFGRPETRRPPRSLRIRDVHLVRQVRRD